MAPRPDQKKLYIDALEDRVAELETFLSSLGHNSVGDDHWIQKQHQFQDIHQQTDDLGVDQPNEELEMQKQQQQQQQQKFQEIANKKQDDKENEEIDILLAAVRDLLSNSTTHYVKGTSAITKGRVLKSVINSQKAPSTELETKPGPGLGPNTRSMNLSEPEERMGPMFVAPQVANRLLEGWMKYFSTRYPVIYSPRLKELHVRRNEPLDIYEESILHLVYANSGRFIETVSQSKIQLLELAF